VVVVTLLRACVHVDAGIITASLMVVLPQRVCGMLVVGRSLLSHQWVVVVTPRACWR